MAGQHPKLPLLMRATEGSWWENSDFISDGEIRVRVSDSSGSGGLSLGFLWLLESPFVAEVWSSEAMEEGRERREKMGIEVRSQELQTKRE